MDSDRGSTGSSSSPPGTLAEYLARVEERLRTLPERDRREIVDETRSHFAGRYGGLPEFEAAASATTDLGLPEAYAKAFLEEYGVQEAAPRQRLRRVVFTVSGALLVAVAIVFLVFGLINALTPPWAESVWFIWRDVGLGDYGWLLFALGSWMMAGAAAIAAAALFRRTRGRG